MGHLLKKGRIVPILPAALLCLLTACQGNYSEKERQLTVSIEPLRYITEAIAGDCYTIHTLTPEGMSPEAYMPTPQQITGVNQSTAYIYMGSLGFEQQNLNKIVENCPHLYVINVSENIKLLPHEGECSTCDSADPHLWTSVENMKTIANNIFKTICHIDTINVGIYRQRYQKFLAHLDSVDTEVHRMLDSAQHRSFLINHPSLAYFTSQYGLKQLSIEKDGKEASPERVAQLIEQCRKEGIKTVFLQKQNNKRTAVHIAEELKADTFTVNPLTFRWDREMLRIAKILQR